MGLCLEAIRGSCSSIRTTTIDGRRENRSSLTATTTTSSIQARQRSPGLVETIGAAMPGWTPHGLNVTLSAKPLGGYPPLQVSFSGSATGGVSPYSYSWSFGDGSVSSQQNATHNYSIKGVYIATLNVVDASTVSGSNEISITVLAPLGSLNLRVLDTNSHPVPQANVTLTRTPLGQQKLSSLTNNLGTAGFTMLRAGMYTVQASNPGYVTATKNVTVVVGQTTNDQLVLVKAAPANSFPWALAG